ncbi:hypothetical protein BD309DRAFT_1071053 [Dichomitus squalens]|nr:hypothetical protein BD309DRAFT_1071053 [Dichomitus squalens]
MPPKREQRPSAHTGKRIASRRDLGWGNRSQSHDSLSPFTLHGQGSVLTASPETGNGVLPPSVFAVLAPSRTPAPHTVPSQPALLIVVLFLTISQRIVTDTQRMVYADWPIAVGEVIATVQHAYDVRCRIVTFGAPNTCYFISPPLPRPACFELIRLCQRLWASIWLYRDASHGEGSRVPHIKVTAGNQMFSIEGESVKWGRKRQPPIVFQ